MVTSLNGYKISISEDNHFDDETFMYRQIIIKKDGKTKMVGVVLDETGDEFDFMRNLFEQLNNFLNLPLVETLPEPLRTIVKEQEQSTYGMWFYDNEEDFPFTEDGLKLLDKQINQYNLEYIIEVNPDAGIGDPIITCYMSLCTYFNFLSPEFANQHLRDAVQKFLKRKEVDLDLSGWGMVPIINSWSCDEAHWYCDGYNICCDAYYHDGVNHYMHREIRNLESIQKFLDMIYYGEDFKSVINHYTRSIASDVAKIYGFVKEVA